MSDLPKTRRQAVEAGAARYFTGAPCANGHAAERVTKDGHCVVCNVVRLRAKRAADPAAHARRNRDWNAANPEKKKASDRKWADANRDRKRAQRRRWKAENSEKWTETQRRWKSKNPGKQAQYDHVRRARENAAEGSFTDQDVARIRRAQRDKCGCCRIPLDGGGHIDHIRALSKGGTNWPANLQLLCQPCNQAKHDRDAVDFMQSRGFLL